jgi:hypothetical protein
MCHIVTRKRSPPPDDRPDRKGAPLSGGAALKERVIHTRVPESLENHLRERAEDLGISVSNLVRNVLGHAFGLVGGVVADGQEVARAARGRARSDDVVGWQMLVLGKNAVCAHCNDILPKGSEAAAAVGASGRLASILCVQCMKKEIA